MGFGAFSIRSKIVVLAGICLLGIVVVVVFMNIHLSQSNNTIVAQTSERMMIDNAKTLLQAEAGEQAAALYSHFQQSILLLTSVADLVG